MKKTISICLILFVVISIGVSQKKDFEMANTQYNQKAYPQAIAGYQRLLKEGFVSEDVYYNLGNSYYKNEQYGYAVLYYEKTLKINPNNKRAKINLSLTQKKLKDKTVKAPEIILIKIWNKFIALLSPNQWAIFWFFSVWGSFFCGLVVLYSKQTSYRRFNLTSCIIFLFLACFTGSIAFLKHRALYDNSLAIVINPTIDLKNSPDLNSNTVQVVYEGTKVRLEDRIGNWHKIKLEDGKTVGWIENKSFEVI
jgi:tetratricopeptide (TPR) repeat protein